MPEPYVVTIEGPDGISAVTFEAANDPQAFIEAAKIVEAYIDDLDPHSVIEVMRPDATAMDTRPTAEWMARFADRIEKAS